MPIPTHVDRLTAEIHHNITTKKTQLVMRDNRGQCGWISCDFIDLIYTAANRVWERGQSNNWYSNHAAHRRPV